MILWNLWLQAVDILQPDYEPSDLDILYAEGLTSSNGIACVEFSFPQSADDGPDTSDQQVSLPRYTFSHLCILVLWFDFVLFLFWGRS